MKLFIICLTIAISSFVKSETFENENFEDDSEDNSVFDKILAINQKSARSRSGHQPKLFEGDIVVTDSVKEMIDNRKRGAATKHKQHIWPIANGKHEIPYYIGGDVSYARTKIERAMGEWMNKVPCLRFVRRSNHRGYLHFHAGSGCSSAVGRQGRRQMVSLAGGCMYHGIIVHEIGHALGFWHEQSRADRDQYITIHWNNINDNMAYNFKIMTGNTDDTAAKYDYGSIMHYGPKAFSKNGRVTISPKDGRSKIGQRQGLSEGDIYQAKLLYKGCRGGGSTGGGIGGGTGGGTGGGGTACLSDKDSHCASWASGGYCRNQENVDYMMANCKKSCCVNKHERCQEWANRGECTKNPRYMLPNCTAACDRNNCRC